MKLKNIQLIIVSLFLVGLLAGCQSPAYLTVDFNEGETLRYQFTSDRKVEMDWQPDGEPEVKKKDAVKKMSESMDMVVAYTPTEVDPFGVSTVNAKIESIDVDRRSDQQIPFAGSDAATFLRGKEFTLKVLPSGKIVDYSSLDALIKEMGEKSIRGTDRRIKDPDMVRDFAQTQWFLWDAVSSIKGTASGLNVGNKWKSREPFVGPMLIKKGLDVAYELSEITTGADQTRKAVIDSTYTITDETDDNWPKPYSGKFQISGNFGFLRGYTFEDFQGQGKTVFNVDAGVIEKQEETYTAVMRATTPMGDIAKPRITMTQKFTMELLHD